MPPRILPFSSALAGDLAAWLVLFLICGAGGVSPSTLGRGGLLFLTALLRHARSVFGLGILHSGGLFAPPRVLTGRLAGAPFFGARLLLCLLRRRSTLHGASLRRDTPFAGLLRRLARRFGEVGEAFPAEVLEHLPHDGSGKIEVQGEVLRMGEGLVGVPLVAKGSERPGDVLGWDEGVPTCGHAQVLEEHEVQATDHADYGFGLVDVSPDEESRVVAVGP